MALTLLNTGEACGMRLIVVLDFVIFFILFWVHNLVVIFHDKVLDFLSPFWRNGG